MGLSVSVTSPCNRWALPAVRPLVEVAGFALLFLIVSLLVAVPFALATGRALLGLGYILPFTFVFVLAYQRLVHRESLRELGLDPRAPYLRFTSLGFAGCGLGALAIQAAQLESGAMEIRSLNILTLSPEAVAGGVALALALNLGIGAGEELIFRGYVLRRLVLGYGGRVPAVAGSSLLFSLVHVPQGDSALVLLNLFLLGVVLALAALLTGSLWASIGIHMGWNFWSDGIYFFLPGARAARVLSYGYHLHGWDELLAFKLVSAFALVAVAGWIARRRVRAGHAPAPTEVHP